jgi:hypothetical protein
MQDILDALGAWLWLLIGGLLLGVAVLVWIMVLGPLFNQADYNNFNNSPQHIQAVAQKFSDDCLQLAQTHDATARKAIENDIYSVAATVDLSKVQMPGTTRSCVEQAISDVTH